jgi:hypothetical protein
MSKKKMVQLTGAQVLSQMLASTRMMEAVARETSAMLQAIGYRYDEHTGCWVRVRNGRIETVTMEY